MKNLITILVLVFVVFACKNETKEPVKDTAETTEVKVETPEIALADFDTKAGEFVDKEIMVKGIVDHVCKHGGKNYC